VSLLSLRRLNDFKSGCLKKLTATSPLLIAWEGS
jgi:hypothetical protein